MMWERVKLADVSDSCLGKMLDQRKNKGIYKPYLANVNVRWGAFDLDNLQEMKFEDDEDERYGIKYGDLIICEGGEPGRCAIWKEQLPNMKIQKALHRLRVNEEMDYRYVYYWFLLAGKQGALKQYYTGATIMHMPGQKLKEVVIDKPPLDVQRKIGDYLEAFDDLIENNQKQIKLLEEAAQRLYKEWFVDLRFPGYEDVEIVDGVPEGWKEEKLIDIANVQYGFAFDSSLFNSQGKGKQIIRIRNIPSGITDDYTTQEADEQYIVSNGDIVVGMDGEFHINSWCGKTAYASELNRLMKYIDRADITEHTRKQYEAIAAIYAELQKKRKHVNTTNLMIEINSIISSYIEIQHMPITSNQETRRFDISAIDFGLLRTEFAKVKRKNLVMRDLEEIIQQKLDRMLFTNPERINYYERYQQIIMGYNAEQDRATIEKTFMDLMDLANQMNQEEQRYAREGFSSDEELSLYDMLFRDDLSKNDIKKLKEVATTLLRKIKNRIAEIDHWTDKQETKAEIDNLIRNILYDELPLCYDEISISTYRQRIYEYVYTRYKSVA